MTGVPSLNLSAICWASLKLRGTTRWTRTDGCAGRRFDRPRPCRPENRRACAWRGLGLCPVLELGPPTARREPAHVRALAIRALELLVRDVAVLVPVFVLLGDAEVDEGSVPDVCEAHSGGMLTLIQHRPNSNHGRAFLYGHFVILARSHRKARQAAFLSQFPQFSEVRTGLLGVVGRRRHRREADESPGRARGTPGSRPARRRTCWPRPRG